MSGDLKTWCVDANNSEGVTNMSDVQGVTMATVESMIADLERRREEVYRALREERSRLTSRIAEIDAVMAKVGASALPERRGRVAGRAKVGPVHVAAWLAEHPRSSRGQIARALGMSDPTLRRVMDGMIGRGEIVMFGNRRGATYGLATPEAAE